MTHYKEILVPIISKFLPTAKIFLYGSRARGDFKSGSDVDIALDNGTKIDLTTISLLKEAVEDSSIPVFVDIVDVHSISPDFKEEIQNEWILWKN